MLRIVVCVSGGGTNLQAIIDGVKTEPSAIQKYQVLLVITPVHMQ